MALTHEHITPLQAALAAAFPDPLLAFTRTSGPRCAADKIPLHKPCPLPCLDVNLGLVFISSKAESYVEAGARSMEVPGLVSPQTHLDSRVPLLRSAWPQCWGTWSSHGPSALAHVLLGTWRQGVMPFTPFPSQQSLHSQLSLSLFHSFCLFLASAGISTSSCSCQS